MIYVALFLAGAFLCNAIPHLAAGLMGQPFPTPFATPRGVGDSSPVVNFLWGFLNLLVGAFLWSLYPVHVGLFPGFVVLLLGAFVIGLYLALHFGKVRRDKRQK
jgi:uncharacterized membrane protein SpoIIM required for sporulation